MSSSPFSSFPIFSGKEAIIYGGISVLILGMIGEIFNVIVFLSLRTFRQNSCAFYLTILSIVNVGQLITGLLSRILINGFAIDWTATSLFYCKFRAFIFQTCTLVSFTCTCLATIDQYFATSTRPHWQQLASIRVAHRWIVITVSVWSLHGIPYIIFYDHLRVPSTNVSYCTSTNSIYKIYHSYIFLLIFNGIVPVIITAIFACLAYRNVRRMAYRAVPLVRRELDRQLTVMVLVQVCLNFFTVLPFLIVNTIATHTSNKTDQRILARIQLIGSVCLCLYYLSFANSFYIYMCVSERFRRQFIYVVFRIRSNRELRRKTIFRTESDQRKKMSSSAIEQHKLSQPTKASELVEASIENSPSRPPPVGGVTSSQNETAPSTSNVTTSMTDRPQN